MEREKKKQENIAGLSIQEDQQEKKNRNKCKTRFVREDRNGWMAHETYTGCVLSRPEKEREEARSTAVCLIFVFFQDFENVGRTFGCCLRAEKQQLLYSYRMEPAELD
jgi:hypothetical protein